MKVYEKLNNLVPCVNVYIKNRDTGEELKFFSHDAGKISKSEKGRKFFNLEIVSYRAYGYIPLVDIEAAEPGTIPPDYYEKETEKKEKESADRAKRVFRNLVLGADNWIRELVKEEIEVQHGYRTIEKLSYRCPRCKWKQGHYSNYCPNCGMELMEGENA